MGSALLISLATIISSSLAQYNLVDHRQGSNFFDGFDFFTGGDPTHGFVNYVNQGTAQGNGLISTSGSQVYMGVDYTSVLAADGSQGGRQSVRLTSKASYTEGLFILDAQHMPGGVCGTWPAWWTVGPNWPNQGEIDIIEGVNSQTTNLISLHTSDQCSTTGAGGTASVVTGDCYQYDPNQSNSGCGVSDKGANVYGTPFNQNGGGVYAMEWTGASIKVWFFPRNAIPGDITAGAPNPGSWGTPRANHANSCNIPGHFAQHNVVFDTTFCGDWGGSVFGSDPVCGSRAGGNCQAYVAGSPGDFKEAYWSINYMSVYQTPGEGNGGLGSYNEPLEPPTAGPLEQPVPAADPAEASRVVNAAMGGSTLTGGPPKVEPMKIDQLPAIANTTTA
ncbi:MAG: hypothetical protein Q9162_000748 [Coniocarpon cinnabarinum]